MFDVFNRLFSKEIVRLGLVVVFILLIVFGLGVRFLNKNAQTNANSWLQGDIERFKSNKDIIFSSAFENESMELKNRLEEQFDMVRNRAKTHQTIMVFYYSKYYMAITLATITGIIASLMLLIISKKGWENTNKYIITIFLTFSGLTAYFSAFPTLFDQKSNIEANKKLYANYLSLEDKILSYVVTKEGQDNKVIELNVFVHKIDVFVEKTNQLPIELNHDGIQDTVDSMSNRINSN